LNVGEAELLLTWDEEKGERWFWTTGVWGWMC
jgi:hypothetical protein